MTRTEPHGIWIAGAHSLISHTTLSLSLSPHDTTSMIQATYMSGVSIVIVIVVADLVLFLFLLLVGVLLLVVVVIISGISVVATERLDTVASLCVLFLIHLARDRYSTSSLMKCNLHNKERSVAITIIRHHSMRLAGAL